MKDSPCRLVHHRLSTANCLFIRIVACTVLSFYSDISRKQCLTCLCLDSLVDSTVPMTPGTLPASMSPDTTPAGATRDTTPAGATPATTPAGATPGTLPSVSVSMTPATLPPGQASSQSTSEYSSVPASLPCRQCVL